MHDDVQMTMVSARIPQDVKNRLMVTLQLHDLRFNQWLVEQAESYIQSQKAYVFGTLSSDGFYGGAGEPDPDDPF